MSEGVGNNITESNLINCPDCEGKMAKSAYNCLHCGSTTYQTQEAEKKNAEAGRKIAQAEKKIAKDKKDSQTRLKKIIVAGLVLIVASLIWNWDILTRQSYQKTRSKSYSSKSKVDCYEWGYKYGMAAARASQGRDPGPYGDARIPLVCRGDNLTDLGMRDGAESVFQ